MSADLRVAPEDERRFYELADDLLDRLAGEIRALPAPSPALDRSGEIIADSLLEWKWRYGDGRLGHWTGAEVEEYLLDFFPRQMPSDGQLVADAPACVSEFMRLLERRGELTGERADALAERCESLRKEFQAAAFDRERWGISKTFATQMQSEGMDPTDPDALQSWMADFNSRPLEERDRIIGPALDGQQRRLATEMLAEDSDPASEAV